MSDYYGKPGADMLHEVTESYHGGVMSQQSGISAGMATVADSNDPNSVYSQSHEVKSTKQSGEVWYNYTDRNGQPSTVLYRSGHANYYVQDPEGTPNRRPPLVIQTYP